MIYRLVPVFPFSRSRAYVHHRATGLGGGYAEVHVPGDGHGDGGFGGGIAVLYTRSLYKELA